MSSPSAIPNNNHAIKTSVRSKIWNNSKSGPITNFALSLKYPLPKATKNQQRNHTIFDKILNTREKLLSVPFFIKQKKKHIPYTRKSIRERNCAIPLCFIYYFGIVTHMKHMKAQ